MRILIKTDSRPSKTAQLYTFQNNPFLIMLFLKMPQVSLKITGNVTHYRTRVTLLEDERSTSI